MTHQGGMGLDVKIDISSTLTAVVSVLEGEIPEFEKYLAEMTPHSAYATGGWAEHVATGKRKMNEFKLTLGWDADEATHAAVLTAFNSNDPVAMSVASPNDDEIIAFDAHVRLIGRMSEQEDGYKAEVTIQPTGAPTIT